MMRHQAKMCFTKSSSKFNEGMSKKEHKEKYDEKLHIIVLI